MKTPLLIAGLGLAAYSVYVLQNNQGQVIDLTPGNSNTLTTSNVLANATQSTLEFIDRATMGIFSIGNMNRAKAEMLTIPNVRAMLAVIRKGEGTSDSDGYRRIFGGQLFSSFLDHPRILVKKSGYKSTAAGAYQFLSSTWDETRAKMKLKDFSPASQDLAALGRIAARGALDDVIAGRFVAAINKLGKEWASLPGSPYGQPTQTFAGALAIYTTRGGAVVV